jgi:hypothetical protein
MQKENARPLCPRTWKVATLALLSSATDSGADLVSPPGPLKNLVSLYSRLRLVGCLVGCPICWLVRVRLLAGRPADGQLAGHGSAAMGDAGARVHAPQPHPLSGPWPGPGQPPFPLGLIKPRILEP